MIARASTGWQTLFADLSLILFMITASAVSQAHDASPPPPLSPSASAGMAAMAEPVAVWRPSIGGTTLAQWLADQPRDARLRLTLHVHASAGDEAAALRLAGGAAPQSRLVIDREPGPSLEAILAYDQSLQSNRITQP